MTGKKIQVVEIHSTLEDVPILEEAMAALEYDASSYADKEKKIGTTYVLAENMAQAKAWKSAIETALASWTDCLNGPISVTVNELLEEDWSQSWKKNFHTFRASNRLVVKPSWEEFTPGKDDLVLALDPGMCFGTGYHGTTKACLQFLDELEAKQGSTSFLDAGTGSGILSMGARLLGYSPVKAFDNDPQCIGTALENLALCGIHDVEVTVADLSSYTGPKASVVAANILAVVLLKYAEQVVSYVKRPGHLILSGILTEQYQEVLEKYQSLGLKEIGRKTIDEWTSGCFKVGE